MNSIITLFRIYCKIVENGLEHTLIVSVIRVGTKGDIFEHILKWEVDMKIFLNYYYFLVHPVCPVFPVYTYMNETCLLTIKL